MSGEPAQDFGVYVHWPFCLSKCPYCDFNSHVRHGAIDEARGLAELRDGARELDEVIIGNVGTLGRGMKVQIVGNERGNGPGGARGGSERGTPSGNARGGAAGARKPAGDSGSKIPPTAKEQGGRKPRP